MSNVDIKTTPVSSDVEQYVRQYTSTEDPDCIQRSWPSSTPKLAPTCPQRIYMNRDITPQCAGADIMATLTFNTNMTGQMGKPYKIIFIYNEH